MSWRVNGTSAASLNVTGLRSRRLSQAVDEFGFELPLSLDAAAPSGLAAGDTVVIERDTGSAWVRWGVGRVVRIARVGTAAAERLSYDLAGPWWYLDHLVFQQPWMQQSNTASETPSLVTRLRSRVVLGATEAGARRHSGQVITDVLTYAIAAGAPIAIGTIGVAADLPLDERVDITCAEVIRSVLRWTPDAMVWWDYTTTPHPTMHVTRRSSATSATIAMTAAERVELRSRAELRPPAVALKYERQVALDGVTWADLQEDIHPGTATGQEFGALVQTLQLAGSSGTTQVHEVETTDVDPCSASWWQSMLPWLADASISSIVVTGGTTTHPGQRRVSAGEWPAWVTPRPATATATAKISYRKDGPNGSRTDITEQAVSAAYLATTQTSRTYRRVVYSGTTEAVPVGLAQQIYEGLQHDHWEGVVSWSAQEVDGAVRPGQVARVTGGLAAWATMDALIQQVEEDVDGGRTTITVGAPGHLGARDLLELIRSNRLRTPAQSWTARTTGQAVDAGLAQHGVGGERRDSSGSGSTTSYMRIASGTNRHVELDPALGAVLIRYDSQTIDLTVPAARSLSIREVDVCDDGAPKKMLILASAPYVP